MAATISGKMFCSFNKSAAASTKFATGLPIGLDFSSLSGAVNIGLSEKSVRLVRDEINVSDKVKQI